MRVTRLTGTEAAVCVSRGTAEKRSSAGENAEEKWTCGWVTSAWRLLRRVLPPGFPRRAYGWRVIDRRNRSCTKVLSNIFCPSKLPRCHFRCRIYSQIYVIIYLSRNMFILNVQKFPNNFMLSTIVILLLFNYHCFYFFVCYNSCYRE